MFRRTVALTSIKEYNEIRKSRDNPTLEIEIRGEISMNNMIVDNAKVMAKGQITLPKEIRTMLGIDTGDRVTLICEGDQVIMMNAAVYAMKMLHKGMEGEAEKSGMITEEDINNVVKDVRDEVEA